MTLPGLTLIVDGGLDQGPGGRQPGLHEAVDASESNGGAAVALQI